MPLAPPRILGAKCPDCGKIHGRWPWQLSYWKARLTGQVQIDGGSKYVTIKCSDCARKRPG